MATPKKRYRYTFLYTDQTYLTYELTKEDFEKTQYALCYDTNKGEIKFVAVSIGIIGLDNIRSIIEQKEEEEQQPELDEDGNSVELPVLDQESYNWIKQYLGEDK
jgi:hypothetical protein